MTDAVAARPSWRPERRAGLDPDLKRLGVIAAALALGMGLGIAAWGLLHSAPHGLPVVEAASGPVRVKPDNPGGMTVAGSDDSAAPGATDRLAPPPEQPEIAVLRARLHAAQRALAKQQLLAKSEAGGPRIAPAPPVQRAVALARPAAAAIPPILAPQVPPSAAPVAVQLGAFETAAAARAAWGVIATKSPALLARKTPLVLQADLAGRPVWRLRTGAFANNRDAAAFCAEMRETGADCAVAAF